MPQMYPTQWLILTNMMILLFLFLMSLLKQSSNLINYPLTKTTSSKSWKW